METDMETLIARVAECRRKLRVAEQTEQNAARSTNEARKQLEAARITLKAATDQINIEDLDPDDTKNR